MSYSDSIGQVVPLGKIGILALAGVVWAVTRPLPDSSAFERAPIVFVEQGTHNCVAAFRRGAPNDPNGVTGVQCLAVADERRNGHVIEKFVPQGTTFIEVMEQFSYADPWSDEFVALDHN